MSEQASTDIDVKLCRKCKRVRKFPEDFYKDKTFKAGHHVSRCKYCSRIQQFQFKHKDIDVSQDFEELLAAVETGICTLCGAKPRQGALIFDTNKVTKRWRGLLDRSCFERVKDYDGLDAKQLRQLARDANPHLAKFPKYMLSR